MKYFLFVAFFLLASCVSKKKLAEFEAQPEWIRQKPVEAEYYIGIGSAKKVGTPLQYSKAAKEDALADLASEIATQVSSSSVLHTIETDYGNSQTFNQRIETRASDYLEGFEPVEFYETEDDYWVYYRIRRNDYLEAKARKKETAVSAALARYNAGFSAEKEHNFVEAIQFYLKGLQALREYLQEDTPAEFQGRSIDIGNALYSSLSEIVNGLSIEAVKEDFTIKQGKSLSEKVVFYVSKEDIPVFNMPVTLTYSGGYLSENRGTSNRKGHVSLDPGVIRSKNSHEYIYASIDFASVARAAVDDLFIRGLINNRKTEPAQVTLFIKPISILLNLEGSSCENLPCDKLVYAFEDILKSENFISGTSSPTDFIYELTFNFKPGDRAGGLMSVYLISRLEIMDSSGSSVWKKEMEPIQGVGKTEEGAREKAFDALHLALRRIWFQTGLDAIR